MSEECEGLYFVMGKTAILDGFLQSDLDCAGFHLLNCPDLPTFVPPVTFSPLANEWLTGFDGATGLFSGSQPKTANLSDWPSPGGAVGKFFTMLGGDAITPVYGWASVNVAGTVPAGGTTGQMLAKKSNSDFDMLWQTPSGGSGGGGTPAAVRAFSTVNQSVPNMVSTPLSFNGVRYDLNGQWSNTSPTRLKVNLAGTYTVFATIDWGGVSLGAGPQQSGTRVLTLRVNGTLAIAVDSNNADVTTGGDTYQTVQTQWTFAAGDYVELLALQSSGAALTIMSGANWSPEFGMVMEGGIPGPAGATGQGVPAGGTTGQVLAKVNATDYNTNWVTPAGGPGGGVTQVNTAAPLTGGPITSSGTIGIQNALAGQFLGYTGTGQGVPTFQALPTPATFQSAQLSPAATASNAGVMMGMGSSIQFKPVKSGTVLVMVSGVGNNTVAGGWFQALGSYGTGTPPSNGSSIRGTLFSGTIGTSAVANADVPFCLIWIVKLSVNINYWFDMVLRASSGVVSLDITSFTLIEL